MAYKDFLDAWFEYDQIQIGTAGKNKVVQKQKGGNGTRQLQIMDLIPGPDGESKIHVNYNKVQKKSLWQKLCGWFAGKKPNGDYRKETK